MRTQRMLTSKNSAKLKQYYYFHAEFLEEIRYGPSSYVFTGLLDAESGTGAGLHGAGLIVYYYCVTIVYYYFLQMLMSAY